MAFSLMGFSSRTNAVALRMSGVTLALLTTVASAQNSSLLHAPHAGSQPMRAPIRTAVPQGIAAGMSAQAGSVTQGIPVQMAQYQRGTVGNGPSGVGQTMQGGPAGQAVPGGQIGGPQIHPYDRQPTPDGRPPVSLAEASWTYQAPPPLRVFQKNDVVTIRVDEITSVMAEGAAESRKRTLYEAILTDWIKFNDFSLQPDPQLQGDPAVASESNANYRAESTVESRESLTFNIAATVVDIRPNGTLVLEGTKAIRVNDNLWETSISGICRAEDIGPDNVVLSKDLIDLEIGKQDRGHLRDGYKRGWFKRWFDRVQPF